VKYILDANIFIEAKRRYYAFNLCPGFWDSLLYHNSIDNLESIDHVKDELSEGDDLDAWKKQASGLFASTDDKNVITAYREINQWVQNQKRFTQAAKSEFARNPDAWVIAYAKANNAIVVTHEAPAPNSKRKVQIPDVCKQFNVQHTNTFNMLLILKVIFFWKSH
jgi:predicted nuclease of predicted toxin-antitoxin system